MTASFVLAAMEGRTVATGAGPWWEFALPAVALAVVVACLKAPGWVERLRRAGQSRLTQADVDEAFDRAAARAAIDRARREATGQ